MRLLATGLAVFFVLLASSATAEKRTLPPGPATVTVTAVQRSSSASDSFTRTEYGLFNKPAYRNRIGTLVVLCSIVSAKWLACTAYLRLTRGTIVADGLFPAVATFRSYAVVGGTGYYANSGGSMVTQPLDHSLIITALLDAF